MRSTVWMHCCICLICVYLSTLASGYRKKAIENEVLEDDPHSTKPIGVLITQTTATRSDYGESSPGAVSPAPSPRSDDRDNVAGNALVADRSTWLDGDRDQTRSKFIAPIHGHHWPFDRSRMSSRSPIRGSYSVEGTFLWAVGLFGTVENGAIVLSSMCTRRPRKSLHFLVGALGLTDLFISLVYIPSHTYFLLESNNTDQGKVKAAGGSSNADGIEMSLVSQPKVKPVPPSSLSFCSVVRGIFVEVASVTLTLKAIIAVYLHVFTNSRVTADRVFSPKNTVVFILLAWIANFCVLFCPFFIGYDIVDIYPNAFVCRDHGKVSPHIAHLRNGEPMLFYSVVSLTLHLVELTIICFCFANVHRAIKKGKVISAQHKMDDTQSQLNYIRATKTTILIFVTFCLCWLPIYVINMVDPMHVTLPSELHRAAMDLLLLKSCINPLIYMYGLRSLRHQVKLFCMCKCRADPKTTGVEIQAHSSSFSGQSRSTAEDEAAG